MFNKERQDSWVVVAHTFIPALGRQKHADLCEFEASLVYKATTTITKDKIVIEKKQN